MTTETQTTKTEPITLESVAEQFYIDFSTMAKQMEGSVVIEPLCKVIHTGLRRRMPIPIEVTYREVLNYLMEKGKITTSPDTIPAGSTGAPNGVVGYYPV